MDAVLETMKIYFHNFLVFNQNAIYYILYFLKNYWMYLFVVAAIIFMAYFQIKSTDERFIDDNRRIL